MTQMTREDALDEMAEAARHIVRPERAQMWADAFGVGPIPKEFIRRDHIGALPLHEEGVAVSSVSRWICLTMGLEPTRDGSMFIGHGRAAEANTLGAVEALRGLV